MRKPFLCAVLVTALVSILGLTSNSMMKTYGNNQNTKASVMPLDAKEIQLLPEDIDLLTKAFQNLSDRKKDYDLALAIADRVEADAAANAGVNRKTHELIRNTEGKLVFRVRQPPAK